MAIAPIALFAYNRPAHLQRTLYALQANTLARESMLYVFSDGPKGSHDADAVRAVREIAGCAEGFSKIVVQEREKNLGLAQSVISGVTELANKHGRVIVLEDDLVVAPGFLSFMNQALERYHAEPRVMQISGYMFPVKDLSRLNSTFFSRIPTSWGWATWNRAWNRLERDSSKLLAGLVDETQRTAFNVDGAYPYFEHLALQAEGKLDVWGVRWYASMFAANGLCLYPSRSLVQNIGIDGSGVHCSSSQYFNVMLSTLESWDYPDAVTESAIARELIRSFLAGLRSEQKISTIVELTSRLRMVAGRIKRSISSAVQRAG